MITAAAGEPHDVRCVFGSIALFWLGVFVAVATWAAASVYGFDYYEPNWGRGISLQVSLWIAAVLAAIGAVGFAVGLRLFGGATSKPVAFGAGIAVGVVLLLTTLVEDRIVSTTGGRQPPR
jgi:hypothetical protein